MVRKEMQNPNPTRHLQPRLHLHTRPDSEPTEPIRHSGPYAFGLPWNWKREGLNGKCGGHVLRPAGGDLSGGYEHETHLAAGVEELQRTIVVCENGAVRVVDGDVLGEGEANGGVVDGEGGDLDGVDGEIGVLWLENGEVDNEGYNDYKNQENGGDYAWG